MSILNIFLLGQSTFIFYDGPLVCAGMARLWAHIRRKEMKNLSEMITRLVSPFGIVGLALMVAILALLFAMGFRFT